MTTDSHVKESIKARFNEWDTLGIPYFPLMDNSKEPRKTWKEFENRHPDEIDKDNWIYQEFINYALVMGSISGLVGIDLDPAKMDVSPDVYIEQYPTNWITKTASVGWHLVYRLPPGIKIKNSTGTDTKGLAPGVDVKGEGGYLVAPGSVVVYRDAKEAAKKKVPINFRGEYTQIGTGEPSMLPDDLLELLRVHDLIIGQETRKQQAAPAGTYKTTPAEELARMLSFIPPKGDYTSHWWAIGAAIHSEFPDDEGIQIFENWSPGKPGEAQVMWNSMNQNIERKKAQGVKLWTMGTIRYLARQNGYQEPAEPIENLDFDFSEDDEPLSADPHPPAKEMPRGIPDGIMRSINRVAEPLILFARVFNLGQFDTITQTEFNKLGASHGITDGTLNRAWHSAADGFESFPPILEVYLHTEDCKYTYKSGAFRLKPQKELVEMLKTAELIRIHEKFCTVNPPQYVGDADTRVISLPTLKMLQDSGVKNPEKALEKAIAKAQKSVESRKEELSRARKSAQREWIRVCDDLNITHQTSIPAHFPINDEGFARASWLNAQRIGRDGELLSNDDVDFETGISNGGRTAHLELANIQRTESTKRFQIFTSDDIAEASRYGSREKCFPRAVIYLVDGKEKTIKFDLRRAPNSLSTACAYALGFSKTVYVEYNSAKTAVRLGDPLTVRPKKATLPKETTGRVKSDEEESTVRDPYKHRKKWLAGYWQTILEDNGWKRRKGQLISPDGVVPINPADPAELLNLLLGDDDTPTPQEQNEPEPDRWAGFVNRGAAL